MSVKLKVRGGLAFADANNYFKTEIVIYLDLSIQ